MAGPSLTTTSVLMCPHGGTVQIVSSNPRAKAVGAPMATVADSFPVVGCPFQLPGPVPSPCLRVVWQVPDTRVKVGGSPTVSQSSTGLCLAAVGPQGPVSVVSTQPRVTTR